MYLHKCKCMKCGLHFAVASKHERQGLLVCPECGDAGAEFHLSMRRGQLRWMEEVPQTIDFSQSRVEIAQDTRTQIKAVGFRAALTETEAGQEDNHTYLHVVRCQDCGCVFVAYSWYAVKDRLYCPLCGEQEHQDRVLDISDKFIFEFVPGGSPYYGVEKTRVEELFDTTFLDRRQAIEPVSEAIDLSTVKEPEHAAND